MQWHKIQAVDRLLGKEVLGVRIIDGVIVKEPFITFWSPSLNKFYCDPTHYILLPDMPEERSKDAEV